MWWQDSWCRRTCPTQPAVVDQESIHLWADIGVMFLLFSLGLDFSFKKILKMGASPIISTVTIIFCMAVLGAMVGHAFGWSKMDCIFLGGMLAMSSTTIIYKAFDDLGLRQQQFAGMVMSVLILEDILAIVMMVMLSAIASGNSPDGGQMLQSVCKIAFFLVLWLVVGIFAIPLFLRSVRKLINNEVLLIVSLGLCCAMAVFSTKVGFSSAFGAFIMGSILAETIEAEKIIKLVEPVKNLFGAIFFVSVGMLVDPEILIKYAIPIIALVLTILIGQSVFGSFAFMLGGESLKSAMRCGFSMAQIGEFSFIIASLGLSLGVISDFLYPVVVAVSVITTFLTPYMIRLATPAYNKLEHRLPNRLISSLNRLTMSHPNTIEKSKWKRLLLQMAVNTVVYGILSAAIITLMFTIVLPFMRRLLPGWELHWYANAITGLLTVVLISPFLRAMVMKKNHSEEWKALWHESNVNHLPLLFTVLVRIGVAVAFIFYICNYSEPFQQSPDDYHRHRGRGVHHLLAHHQAPKHPTGTALHHEPALARHRGTGAWPQASALRGQAARPRHPHCRLRGARRLALGGKVAQTAQPGQEVQHTREQHLARQPPVEHPRRPQCHLPRRQAAGHR